jgi:hypothetical protein
MSSRVLLLLVTWRVATVVTKRGCGGEAVDGRREGWWWWCEEEDDGLMMPKSSVGKFRHSIWASAGCTVSIMHQFADTIYDRMV